MNAGGLHALEKEGEWDIYNGCRDSLDRTAEAAVSTWITLASRQFNRFAHVAFGLFERSSGLGSRHSSGEHDDRNRSSVPTGFERMCSGLVIGPCSLLQD